MPRPTTTLAIPLLLTLPLLAGSTKSSVTLHSSRNPSTFGHTVTLTAAVRPVAATGTVTFSSGTTVLETEPLSNGEAQFTTTLLPADGNALKAYYSGDGTYAPSTSAVLTQTVNAIPGGALQPPLLTLADIFTSIPVVADFNGDGKADLAGVPGDDGFLGILLGNGDGTFQPMITYPLPQNYYAQCVAVGDFNGDGRMDVVVASQGANNVSIFLGNGDGTFQAASNYQAWAEPVDVAVADFNGDGKADLAVINAEGGGVAILLGNGNGSFQTPLPTDTSPASTFAAVGDFNGDGKPDLAITNSGSAGSPFLTVLLGNGDGTFQTPQTYTGFDDAQSVVTADFNGDGKTDLAVMSNGQTLILLGNGDGTFQTPMIFPGSNNVVTVSDLNGDGKPDLVECDGAGVSVMLGNGDGTFQTPVNYFAFNTGLSSVAVADFNGDGRVDIASQGYSDFGILLATPAGETATGLTSSLNPSTYGQPVTLTATVYPLEATGTISFYSGYAGLGKIDLTNGQATITISTLNGGSDSLTAQYSGDATHPKSESVALIQTVNRASTFVGLTSSPDPSNPGQTVTFKATVSSTTATGTVAFFDGTTNIGTGTVGNGIATLPISTLSAGNHSITAIYSGDGNYEPGTSPNRIQKVN